MPPAQLPPTDEKENNPDEYSRGEGKDIIILIQWESFTSWGRLANSGPESSKET